MERLTENSEHVPFPDKSNTKNTFPPAVFTKSINRLTQLLEEVWKASILYEIDVGTQNFNEVSDSS